MTADCYQVALLLWFNSSICVSFLAFYHYTIFSACMTGKYFFYFLPVEEKTYYKNRLCADCRPLPKFVLKSCVCVCACAFVYEDELQELMQDCKANFVITDIDHVERVQFAASSANDGSTDMAADLNVR